MLLSPAPFLSDHIPFAQSPVYAATLEALGVPHWTLSEPEVGRMLVVERKLPIGRLQATTRGPVWETQNKDTQLAVLRAAGLHLINAENTTSADTLRRAGYIRLVTPAHFAIMDLLADLPQAMAPKWRNAWRKSQRADLHVVAAPFDPARDSWILALEEAHQTAARYQGYPRAFTLAAAQASPRAVWTYCASVGDQPVAAMIFMAHAPTATYHLGWTGPEGRNRNAHHRLLIEAARDFAKLGFLNLDLGQMDTVRAPGLARFKWGSGARVVSTGGTWLRLPGWRG